MGTQGHGAKGYPGDASKYCRWFSNIGYEAIELPFLFPCLGTELPLAVLGSIQAKLRRVIDQQMRCPNKPCIYRSCFSVTGEYSIAESTWNPTLTQAVRIQSIPAFIDKSCHLQIDIWMLLIYTQECCKNQQLYNQSPSEQNQRYIKNMFLFTDTNSLCT